MDLVKRSLHAVTTAAAARSPAAVDTTGEPAPAATPLSKPDCSAETSNTVSAAPAGHAKQLTNPATAAAAAAQPTPTGSTPQSSTGTASQSSVLSLHDFQRIAAKKLSRSAWAYFSSGSCDEVTLRGNSRDWSLISLRPRVLRSVTTSSLTTRIFGRTMSLPVFICPVAKGGMAHPEGELAFARAAAEKGVGAALSTFATATPTAFAGVVHSIVNADRAPEAAATGAQTARAAAEACGTITEANAAAAAETASTVPKPASPAAAGSPAAAADAPQSQPEHLSPVSLDAHGGCDAASARLPQESTAGASAPQPQSGAVEPPSVGHHTKKKSGGGGAKGILGRLERRLTSQYRHGGSSSATEKKHNVQLQSENEDENISFTFNEDAPLTIFQLYVTQDREAAVKRIRQAKRLGFAALIITVDSPAVPKREADIRIAGCSASVLKNVASDLTWESALDLARTEAPGMPIMAKGIHTWEDAKKAVEMGFDGIIVSNHGGRSLDSVPSSCSILLEIRRFAPEVFAQTTVFVDGGIRRGSDILKTLALGAHAVGIGRPFLYALASGGYEGVKRAVDILQDELSIAMKLLGINSINELGPEHLQVPMVMWERTGSLKDLETPSTDDSLLARRQSSAPMKSSLTKSQSGRSPKASSSSAGKTP